MKTAIVNAKIVTASSVIENGCCAFEGGAISYVGREPQSADLTVDAAGSYLVPGFIDLHCHGGGGLEFMDADEAGFSAIADFHLAHGTTTMLATTLAASPEETEGALQTFARYKEKYPTGTLAGVHLEGPWLNPLQCGAQNVAYMKAPTADEVRRIKAAYPFVLRVSAAPELDEGFAFAAAAKELGIVVSAAHTDADFDCIAAAKDGGYKLMTHLYSGMKGVTRRNAFRVAGAVEAGLLFDDVFVEVIADGCHLPLPLLRLIYKCKGRDRICLITDAIRAAGMKDGEKTVIGSLKNGLPVIVEDGVAKLPDRQSFAGSTATTDRLYKTMAKAIGADLVALSRMSSLVPAQIMGWEDRGEVAVGKRADLLLLDSSLSVEGVFHGGRAIAKQL